MKNLTVKLFENNINHQTYTLIINTSKSISFENDIVLSISDDHSLLIIDHDKILYRGVQILN